MSKTETGFRPPHCLAPVAGGGGYLVADLDRVNRSFPDFPRNPSWAGIGRKNHSGAAEELPSLVRSDSIEAREASDCQMKVKKFSYSMTIPWEASPSEERRV